MHSQALIITESASRYLQQLCKHFAHKLPATHTPEAGRIEFGSGVCALQAEGSTLKLDLDADEKDNLDRLKDVVASHLLRFAFREELVVDWS